MTLAQHKDDRLRFDQQVLNSRQFLIPFLEQSGPVSRGLKVLEIGCGEGGVLLPFLERGCWALGVELSETRASLARAFLESYIREGSLLIETSDIYQLDFQEPYAKGFDLILLKDTIEHIPNQARMIGLLPSLLRPGGRIFFGFPPWYMPHGGHQQICRSKFLSLAPYIHLLPGPSYPALLRLFGENASTRKELMEVRSTGISIERFERILRHCSLNILTRRFYLINPIYFFKFGWKPRVQFRWIAAIPYMRDFLTTCVYYVVAPGTSLT